MSSGEHNDKRKFVDALFITQEKERKKIPKNLHYNIEQSLFLIEEQLEMTNVIVLQSRDLINQTTGEMRAMLMDLHILQLDSFP